MSSKPGRCTAGCARGLAAAGALLLSSHFVFADEMSTILGPCAGEFCTAASTPGNSMVLTQKGQSNSASVEQQAILGAYANSATILQSGSGNIFGLTQTGGQNAAGISQSGSNNSATLSQPGGASASISQSGNNLGVSVTQGQNTTIGVAQFGTGAAGAPPVSIVTVK